MLALKETAPLGLRGLFVEATRRGDLEEAHRYAQEAHSLDHSLQWSNEALIQWHAGRAEWEPARLILKKSEQHDDSPEKRRFMAVLLTAEAQEYVTKDSRLALSLAQNALDKVADFIPAAQIAAKLLVKNNDLRKASRLLEKIYTLNPHPDLAETYIHIRHGDTAQERLERALLLSKCAPEHEDSLYCLAKAQLDARHFNEVRALLVTILADKPRTRFCLLMARLDALEHGDPSSQRDWLLRASHAPRDAAWIADGIISDHWQPLSPVSGQLDAFKWQYPIETLSKPAVSDDMLEAFPENALNKTGSKSQLEPFSLDPHQSDLKNMTQHALANQAKTHFKTPPTALKSNLTRDVVFPLANSPDDPGPSDSDHPRDNFDVIHKPQRSF